MADSQLLNHIAALWHSSISSILSDIKHPLANDEVGFVQRTLITLGQPKQSDTIVGLLNWSKTTGSQISLALRDLCLKNHQEELWQQFCCEYKTHLDAQMANSYYHDMNLSTTSTGDPPMSEDFDKTDIGDEPLLSDPDEITESEFLRPQPPKSSQKRRLRAHKSSVIRKFYYVGEKKLSPYLIWRFKRAHVSLLMKTARKLNKLDLEDNKMTMRTIEGLTANTHLKNVWTGSDPQLDCLERMRRIMKSNADVRKILSAKYKHKPKCEFKKGSEARRKAVSKTWNKEYFRWILSNWHLRAMHTSCLDMMFGEDFADVCKKLRDRGNITQTDANTGVETFLGLFQNSHISCCGKEAHSAECIRKVMELENYLRTGWYEELKIRI